MSHRQEVSQSLPKLKSRTVKLRIRRIRAAINRECKAHEAKIASMEKDIRQLHFRCAHDNASFYGDPSGNNDSFHECDDCGYQW